MKESKVYMHKGRIISRITNPQFSHTKEMLNHNASQFYSNPRKIVPYSNKTKAQKIPDTASSPQSNQRSLPPRSLIAAKSRLKIQPSREQKHLSSRQASSAAGCILFFFLFSLFDRRVLRKSAIECFCFTHDTQCISV